MVIGASANRAKFGNKAVRAYLRQGHEVLPVNPHESTIEGLAVFHSIESVPGPIDRATIYVPPQMGAAVVAALAKRRDVGEVWFNPGSESPELVEQATQAGLDVIQACSIVDIGEMPD
jgi:predicted CoA-binding protein